MDPGNRLLWRANLRRLEFEPLRDSLLAIGGIAGYQFIWTPGGFAAAPGIRRRTIYDFVDRANIPDVLINFDFATPDMVTGMRHQTTVPQQALFLMNNPMVMDLARRLVGLPEFVDLEDDTDRLKFLYERIYQRQPKAEEIQLGLEFVNQTPLREDNANPPAAAAGDKAGFRPKSRQASAPDMKRAPLTSWEEYAQALLQANETSFIN